MNMPPETPQDFYDYFSMMLNNKPPNPHGEIGFKAAQLWHEYSEQDSNKDNTQILISLVKVLMPIRFAGSAFLMLWGMVLDHLSKLPVSQQESIWFEIFDPSNQGERAIDFSEQATKILKRWLELVNSANVIEINQVVLDEMANAIYKYYLCDDEWMAFTHAINIWFEIYIDKLSLLESIHAKVQSEKPAS